MPSEVKMEDTSTGLAGGITQTRDAANHSQAGRPDHATPMAFALVVLIGGSIGVAIRISHLGLPPFWGAAIRSGTAGIIFWAIVLARRVALPTRREVVGALLYGLVSISVSYALVYWALLEMQAALASVVLASVPLMTQLLAAAHGLERLRWRGLVGCLLAIAGILVAVGAGLGSYVPIAPLLALIAGAACQAEGAILFKLFSQPHPHVTNAIALSVGAVPLLGLSLAAGEPWKLPGSTSTWIALGYLVGFATVGLSHLFLVVLRRWTASATNTSFLLFPISTMLLAAWLLGEAVTTSFVIGGAVALLGVWVGALSGPRRRTAAEACEQRGRRMRRPTLNCGYA